MSRTFDIDYDSLLAISRNSAREFERLDADFPDVVDFGEGARPRRVRFIHVPRRRGRIERIAMHPMVLAVIRERTKNQPGSDRSLSSMLGVPVHEDPIMPIYAARWETRAHPWVEHDEGDAAWSRPVGYGRYTRDYDTLLAVAMHREDLGPLEIFAESN